MPSIQLKAIDRAVKAGIVGWIALLLAGVCTQLGAQARTGVVVGRVVGPDGSAVTGMRVAAVGAVADAQALVSLGQTDGAGRYRLEEVPPGTYWITAGPLTAPTYFPKGTRAATAQPVTVSAGETTAGVDIVLAAEALPAPAFGVVTGKVMDPNGKPAVDAPVAAITETNSQGRVISLQHSDPSGGYYLELPPGKYIIGIPYLKARGDNGEPPSDTKTVVVTSNAVLKDVDLALTIAVRELPRLLDISPSR